MQFRSKADGSHYPMSKGGTSLQTFSRVAGQDRKRQLSRKHRSRLSTLENPMLYRNFINKLERLNPSFDAEAYIDKSLEPEEMLLDLKKKHPELDIGLKSEDQGAGFREFLDDFGIENSRIQSMVAMQDPPLSESELATLSYVLNNRPPQNIAVDIGLRAPLTTDLRKYSNHPNRLDLKGFKY